MASGHSAQDDKIPQPDRPLNYKYIKSGGNDLKVQLNPSIDKLSGKLNRILFFGKKKEMVDDNIIGSFTYARALNPKSSNTSVNQDNLVLAFQIINIKYNELKLDVTAYGTWFNQAAIEEATLGRTVTVNQLFTSFYLGKYVATLGTAVNPTDLSAGTSLSWVDRDSRVWS